MKGALIFDPSGMLIQQTENVQAARQLRFVDIRSIVTQKDVIATFIDSAIQIERAGLKVELTQSKYIEYPEELIAYFTDQPQLQDAFEELTPGRQRAYVLYFSAAKQSKTRIARILKCETRILDGLGLIN